MSLLSDLGFAVRSLKKAPAFSVAAIAALALGIGPTTAIFSVVYATLLAPLPFPEPDQLVMHRGTLELYVSQLFAGLAGAVAV